MSPGVHATLSERDEVFVSIFVEDISKTPVCGMTAGRGGVVGFVISISRIFSLQSEILPAVSFTQA